MDGLLLHHWVKGRALPVKKMLMVILKLPKE
jgi:hypothetical protein